MAALAESSPASSPEALRAAMSSDGYLFFRGLVDPAHVLAVRAAVLDALDECGWLAAGSSPDDALPSDRVRREEANADPAFFEAYRAVQQRQQFHELAHDPALVATAGQVLGGDVFVHPRKIARIGLPRDEFVVGAHQDFPLNQGSPDVLTAWVSLGHCPDELGGLKVLAGSHRDGLQPVEPVPNVGGLRVAKPMEDDPGWLSADFEPGDVLMFHSLTVHAAKRNHTDRLRLSCDFRYQLVTDPVVQDSLVPHYYPVVPGHDELTEGWTSTASVSVPDGLAIVEPFDPFAGPQEPIRSRLVELV